LSFLLLLILLLSLVWQSASAVTKQARTRTATEYRTETVTSGRGRAGVDPGRDDGQWASLPAEGRRPPRVRSGGVAPPNRVTSSNSANFNAASSSRRLVTCRDNSRNGGAYRRELMARCQCLVSYRRGCRVANDSIVNSQQSHLLEVSN